jgi:hypothetical protein
VHLERASNKLALGVRLSYSNELFEQRFLRFYEGFYRRYAQASLVLGMVLVTGDWLIDYLAYPGATSNFYRITVILPLLVGGLIASFTTIGRERW